MWTISSDGFVKRAGVSAPMFLAGFASERTQQFRVFTQFPGPGFFIIQGFQDLHRDRVLPLFGENLDSAQSLLKQARHDPTVAQF